MVYYHNIIYSVYMVVVMELYTLPNYIQLYCGGVIRNFCRQFNLLPQMANKYLHHTKKELRVLVTADRHRIVSIIKESDV